MSKKKLKALPRIQRNGGCYQLMVDGQPQILLAVEMQNSSASSLEFLEKQGCWKQLKSYNCNAALVPVCWEQVEPEEGHFDFSLVDGIIRAARRHGLRLVLLWFGTWKNATSSYAPAWVKTDLQRFPRCQLAGGRTSRTISPLSQEACQADSRAFARLMEHIHKIDRAEQTVLMVQVENEVGLLGAERDFSPEAEQVFRQPVPAELLHHLRDHWDELYPTLRENMDRAFLGKKGSWGKVFHALAGEAFMAWHFARYIENVVAAGKAAYGLPMFVNCWLDSGSPPGVFPSGGPVAKMLDIWHTAAPSVDAFAPDIYCPEFAQVCTDFNRPFNPLIVPESLPEKAALQAFWAVAQGKSLCFAPFGADSPHCWPDWNWQSEDLNDTYALLREMMPLITAAQAEGRIRGVLQASEMETRLQLGDYQLCVHFNHKSGAGWPPAAGLILQLGPDEFVVAGRGFSVAFAPAPDRGGNADFLWAEEGRFRQGKWVKPIMSVPAGQRIPAFPIDV